MSQIPLPARAGLLSGALLLAGVPAQVAPIAVDVGGGLHDLWEAAEDGATLKVLDDLAFLPLDLVGHPPRDRLRLDRPRPWDDDAQADHVLLPQGGALYRVRSAGTESLLHVTADGHARLLASVTAPGAGPAQLSAVAVACDGYSALIATEATAGGDVLSVDLAAEPPQVLNLTANLAPLQVEEESLRVSSAGAFFVASGELWRVPTGATPAVLDLGLAGLPVQADLALSGDGRRVAAAVGSDASEESGCHVVVADIGGASVIITPAPGPFDAAGNDHPLGPFLALDQTGSLVAYRTATEPQELFVKDVDLPEPALQLTVEPQFPAYIDNVGVLGFQADRTLVFFAGDVTISGVDLQEMMGAAELYLAELPVGGPPSFVNVSLTSGQTTPPYDSAGQLRFTEAVLDPTALRFLLPGEAPNEDQTLDSVSLFGAAYGEATVKLFDALDEDPALHAAGQSTLLVTSLAVPEGVDDEGAIRLHLLPSLHAAPDGALLEIATLPPGLQVDRFLASRDGGLLAFAVSAGSGWEIAVLAGVVDGLAFPVLFQPMGLAPQFAFTSHSAFVAGFGGPSGPFKFALFPTSGAAKLAKLPLASGFPLAH